MLIQRPDAQPGNEQYAENSGFRQLPFVLRSAFQLLVYCQQPFVLRIVFLRLVFCLCQPPPVFRFFSLLPQPEGDSRTGQRQDDNAREFGQRCRGGKQQDTCQIFPPAVTVIEQGVIDGSRL